MVFFDYVILCWLLRMREYLQSQKEPEPEELKEDYDYADRYPGLTYEPPKKKKPDLKVVK